MTRLSTNFGILALACACSARLNVSDRGVATHSDAGAGGTSASSEPPGDAAPSMTSCQDGMLSGSESDIDCGGPDCRGCAAQAHCSVHADCQSSNCRAGLCRAPACDDNVKNGEETSVDCGGSSCKRCASKTCNCASSPQLMALQCDETEGSIFPRERPRITADGESAVFDMCHGLDVVPGAPVCSTFRWTSLSSSERIALVEAVTASKDGQRVVLQNNDGSLSLHRIGGDTTRLALPYQMLEDRVLVSADANKFVSVARLASDARALVRWSPEGGLEVTAEFPPNNNGTKYVSAINADATSAVGYIETDLTIGNVPFRWTEAGGVETLGPLPDNADGVRPVAISEDGSVIVGITTRSLENVDVFRWTPAGGFQILASAQVLTPEGEAYLGYAAYMALTPDGAAVTTTVAYPDASSLSVWRFSASDGESVLSTESPAIATLATPDGSVVIGTERGEYVKWVAQPTVPNQPRQFTAVKFSTALAANGVDLTGWTLEEPMTVSDDGRVIFGRGTCGGVPTVYRWVSEP